MKQHSRIILSFMLFGFVASCSNNPYQSLQVEKESHVKVAKGSYYLQNNLSNNQKNIKAYQKSNQLLIDNLNNLGFVQQNDKNKAKYIVVLNQEIVNKNTVSQLAIKEISTNKTVYQAKAKQKKATMDLFYVNATECAIAAFFNKQQSYTEEQTRMVATRRMNKEVTEQVNFYKDYLDIGSYNGVYYCKRYY